MKLGAAVIILIGLGVFLSGWTTDLDSPIVLKGFEEDVSATVEGADGQPVNIREEAMYSKDPEVQKKYQEWRQRTAEYHKQYQAAVDSRKFRRTLLQAVGIVVALIGGAGYVFSVLREQQ